MLYLYNVIKTQKRAIMKTLENTKNYVLVSFEEIDNSTFSKIEKDFSTKKAAERYKANHSKWEFNNSMWECEVMTKTRYFKETSL
jgi:hypothetical protein